VPGVVYTASAGDTGSGTAYPAASPNVVAVGGTTLTTSGETAWSGTGGGCTTQAAKPSWQSDDGCAQRTEVDIAAVADPSTAVAAYAPFGGVTTPASDSWGLLGGTSAAAPLIAGAFMVAGGAPVVHAARLLYDRGGAHLTDITSGSNGPCDGYLCNAGVGYDGPTGMGTPNGVGAMRSIAGVAQFDALGTTQLSVFRPSTRTWYARGSTYYPVNYGTKGDLPVPADYFGDTFTDAAVYRPSNNTWYIQNGASIRYGTRGDVPVPGDYDGDGVAEIALWRPSAHTFYIRNVNTGHRWQATLGSAADIPVPGDYNGDGTVDAATFRPSNGTWYISSIGKIAYGTAGDIPVPGDYDNDGVSDVAVFRPQSRLWYIRGGAPHVSYGTNGDVPVPGDYDGDGRTDIAVFRPSTGAWYVNGGSGGGFGRKGDIPLPLPYAIYRSR
jgi:hypothetical protein